MESSPTMTNWQDVSKIKRPGMQLFSGLQAVAHGSDSVMYFQWRQSRGSFEKFHGAVIDHSGRADTRSFAETCQVGEALERLAAVCGLSEALRRFSCEIEHSEENLERLLEAFWQRETFSLERFQSELCTT